MKALATLSGALASLLLIILGGLIPAGFYIPGFVSPNNVVDLHSTWQVPAALLCSLVCGPRTSAIATVAYLTVGLFHIPIFHGGGAIRYLSSPSFGYLIGFIPATWLSGKLAMQKNMHTLIRQTLSAIAGLSIIHFCGIINLFLGSILGRWENNLEVLIFNYSLGPLSSQILLCVAVGTLALPLRRITLVE